MEERLQKILSRAGIASRRAAEKIIEEARVTLNGETVTRLGEKADPAKDDIRVDGVRIKAPEKHCYLLLNKPKGVVTTRHDPEGRQTVMDLVPRVVGLFPVGRLDLSTEGLILLTNDGAFAERVAHPRYEVSRVYHVKVRRVPTAETLERLRKGVRVEGQKLAVDRVRVLEADQNTWLEVTLHEGRHHEVRRLMEAVGHQVSKLKRVALGPLENRGLAPGQFRSLTEAEVRRLMAGGPRAATPDRRPAFKLSRRPKHPRASHNESARPATATRPGGAKRPVAATRPAAATRTGAASRYGVSRTR